MSNKVRILIGSPSFGIRKGSRALNTIEKYAKQVEAREAIMPRWERALSIYKRTKPPFLLVLFREPRKNKGLSVYWKMVTGWKMEGVPPLRREAAPEIKTEEPVRSLYDTIHTYTNIGWTTPIMHAPDTPNPQPRQPMRDIFGELQYVPPPTRNRQRPTFQTMTIRRPERLRPDAAHETATEILRREME